MPLSAPPPSWATLQNKPTTVAGFGITDMASQSVSNAATVSSVTAAQVMAANVGMTAGSVGSFCTVSMTIGRIIYGSTVAGSSLRGVDDASGSFASPNYSGTWRNLGASRTGEAGYGGNVATYVRIA